MYERDPYRTASPPRGDAAPRRPAAGEPAIDAVIAAIGGLRVALAIGNREAFGAEATVALLMLALGLWGVVTARPGRRSP